MGNINYLDLDLFMTIDQDIAREIYKESRCATDINDEKEIKEFIKIVRKGINIEREYRNDIISKEQTIDVGFRAIAIFTLSLILFLIAHFSG